MRLYSCNWSTGDKGVDDDRMGDHEGRTRLKRDGTTARE